MPPLPSATPFYGKIRMSFPKIREKHTYSYISPEQKVISITSQIIALQNTEDPEISDTVTQEFIDNPGLIITVATHTTHVLDKITNSRIKIPKNLNTHDRSKFIKQKIDNNPAVQIFVNQPDLWHILLSNPLFLERLDSSETLRYSLLLSLSQFQEADKLYSCLLSGVPDSHRPFTHGYSRQMNQLLWSNYELVKLLANTAMIADINNTKFSISHLQ